MQIDLSGYILKLAETEEERAAAQRLRYRVFVEEMGAGAEPGAARAPARMGRVRSVVRPPDPDRPRRRPRDPLDRVVGVYRLMRDEAAAAGRGFYGASEYDFGPIVASGRRAVELGRSCVAPAHRGGPAMHLLWNGLAEYVLDRGIEILFGVASFPGTDPEPLAEALAYLHHHHLAPPDLRVRARPEHFLDMDRMPRGGGRAGAGAAGDPAADQGLPPARRLRRRGGLRGPSFNTIDVCVVMDTARMTGEVPRVLRAQPGPGGVRGGWNGAEPPALPPPTGAERLRLGAARALGGGGAGGALRGVPAAARARPRRRAGRGAAGHAGSGRGWCRPGRRWRCRRSGCASCGAARRWRRPGAFVANHSSWIDIVALQRAAAPFLVSKAEVRGWPVHRADRPGDRHHVHRPPRRRRPSSRRRSCSPGSPAATGWRSSPRAPPPTGCRCCRSSPRCSASSSRRSWRGGSRCSRSASRYRPARRAAGGLLRLVGRDGLRHPSAGRAGALGRRRGAS